MGFFFGVKIFPLSPKLPLYQLYTNSSTPTEVILKLKCFQNESQQETCNGKITMLTDAIHKLKWNKSPGIDGVEFS